MGLRADILEGIEGPLPEFDSVIFEGRLAERVSPGLNETKT
jgi:hypothetical protein